MMGRLSATMNSFWPVMDVGGRKVDVHSRCVRASQGIECGGCNAAVYTSGRSRLDVSRKNLANLFWEGRKLMCVLQLHIFPFGTEC